MDELINIKLSPVIHPFSSCFISYLTKKCLPGASTEKHFARGGYMKNNYGEDQHLHSVANTAVSCIICPCLLIDALIFSLSRIKKHMTFIDSDLHWILIKKEQLGWQGDDSI